MTCYAGLWKRVYVRVGDGFLSWAISLPVKFGALGLVMLGSEKRSNEYCKQFHCADTYDHRYLWAAAYVYLASIAVSVGMRAYWVWSRGGGPTATSAGTRVVDARTGDNLSLERVLVRSVVSLVSFLACCSGLLWMLGQSRRQMWHDILTKAVVIQLPTA